MKSDEKVIEEFWKKFSPFFYVLTKKECDKVEDFILKTHHESVEEAFKSIEIKKDESVTKLEKDRSYSPEEIRDMIDKCFITQGKNQAIDEIERKKEKFLSSK